MATQPGTGLTLFGGQGQQLPDYMQQFVEQQGGTNIAPRQTVPSLSPEGKTWTIVIDGQKHKMQRRNQDGDLEPLPIMKVVVLNYAKERGRSYYEGEYDPNNVSPPMCWSDDGVAPDASLPGPYTAEQLAAMPPEQKKLSRKIHANCASCPMAIKGSKVIPGTTRAVTACSQHLMVAILPDPTMQLPPVLQKPLRLKLAITSVWDKQSPAQEAQGWLAFDNYVQWLVTRGCPHTALIVTKMKFDPDAPYPKIFFASERPLEPAELAAISPLANSDETKKLLGGSWTPPGGDGVPVGATPISGAPQPEGAPAVVAAAAPPPVEEPAAAPPPAPPAGTDLNAGAPAGYVMKPGETFSYQQYVDGGWTNDQLIANGKLIAAAPPPAAPAEVASPPPAPAAASETVVVGESPAPAGSSSPAETVVTSTPQPTAATSAAPAQTADAVVVTEVAQPAASAQATVSAPAAVVVQEPAQATAPPPAPTPPAEEPAAAAAAAEATPAVSTDVRPDVASLLDEWK